MEKRRRSASKRPSSKSTSRVVRHAKSLEFETNGGLKFLLRTPYALQNQMGGHTKFVRETRIRDGE